MNQEHLVYFWATLAILLAGGVLSLSVRSLFWYSESTAYRALVDRIQKDLDRVSDDYENVLLEIARGDISVGTKQRARHKWCLRFGLRPETGEEE